MKLINCRMILSASQGGRLPCPCLQKIVCVDVLMLYNTHEEGNWRLENRLHSVVQSNLFLTLNQSQVLQKSHTNLAKHSGFLPIYCCKRNVHSQELNLATSSSGLLI